MDGTITLTLVCAYTDATILNFILIPLSCTLRLGLTLLRSQLLVDTDDATLLLPSVDGISWSKNAGTRMIIRGNV